MVAAVVVVVAAVGEQAAGVVVAENGGWEGSVRNVDCVPVPSENSFNFNRLFEGCHVS